MRKIKLYASIIVGGLCLVASHQAGATEWTAKETTEYYSVDGASGAAIYKSIGQNGPVINSGTRTIAVTNWDLKWRRDYQPTGNACVLARATPLVKITYTLPKPTQKLSDQMAQKWQVFLSGITAHEKVHGDLIKKLASDIIAATVGLTVEDDRGCTKIRQEVLRQVEAQFATYKADNKAFEQGEMARGGNIEQLVRALVK
ncbi:MAG: DUF922 domain-containing protein [Ahrensia sp.]|nr:DUF922 domain-containing protein [Ahrensia sp.]